MFQLRAVLGRQSFGPGMLTSQIEIIGVLCPVIKNSMIEVKVEILKFLQFYKVKSRKFTNSKHLSQFTQKLKMVQRPKIPHFKGPWLWTTRF